MKQSTHFDPSKFAKKKKRILPTMQNLVIDEDAGYGERDGKAMRSKEKKKKKKEKERRKEKAQQQQQQQNNQSRNTEIKSRTKEPKGTILGWGSFTLCVVYFRNQEQAFFVSEAYSGARYLNRGHRAVDLGWFSRDSETWQRQKNKKDISQLISGPTTW